jgi:hypothetical protein
VSEGVLFRVRGSPIYVGTLVLFIEDPDVPGAPVERVGLVLDFKWDDSYRMHVVHILVDGRVLHVGRDEIRFLQ